MVYKVFSGAVFSNLMVFLVFHGFRNCKGTPAYSRFTYSHGLGGARRCSGIFYIVVFALLVALSGPVASAAGAHRVMRVSKRRPSEEKTKHTQWSTRDYFSDPDVYRIYEAWFTHQSQGTLMCLFSTGIFVWPLGLKQRPCGPQCNSFLADSVFSLSPSFSFSHFEKTVNTSG